LVRIGLSPKDRAQAAGNWREAMAGTMERRTGPKKVVLESSLAPASQWNPVLPGMSVGPGRGVFARSKSDPGALPKRDEDIAFAPVTALSRWIESKLLSSERLTRIYLERLARFDPRLRCVITLTPGLALEQAKRADAEIAAGRYRSPLHGVPWGVKDLLDTKGIRTTWGAEPFRNRVPKDDAAVIARLRAAGAILAAKLSLGALALNDVWFGGRTSNPWFLEEGSGGSSAGSGAAVSAGLVPFAMGSETFGSIVDPCMRCGTTGLRPTFGRVPRTGAMTLSWSHDKLGPITRSVEDTALVLAAISGPDASDLSSLPSRFAFDATRSVKGLRLGVVPAWMGGPAASDVEPAAVKALEQLGMRRVDLTFPDLPWAALQLLVMADSAASFERLTLSGEDAQLRMQVRDAWPNLFRQSRFISAVDYVQADRLRRHVAKVWAEQLAKVDVLLAPSLRDEPLSTNSTGHPCLVLPTGWVMIDRMRSDWLPPPGQQLPAVSPPRKMPSGVSLIGHLWDEGTVCAVGMALEGAVRMTDAHPPGFA
ncbi:MAG: amidase, partial [Myxococcaceae bacterium]